MDRGGGYEIPSASSGDQSLEGFSIATGGTRAGRVAAINESRGERVVIVDTGDSYRPLTTNAIAEFDTVNRVIHLAREGEELLAAAAAVEPKAQRVDSPRLVRHIPRELDRLLVEGERVTVRPSALWYVGAPLLLLGVFGFFAPVAAFEADASRAWVWVSIASPLVVLAAGIAAIWIAMSRDSRRRLSVRDTLADALSAPLGISPRTRRRG